MPLKWKNTWKNFLFLNYIFFILSSKSNHLSCGGLTKKKFPKKKICYLLSYCPLKKYLEKNFLKSIFNIIFYIFFSRKCYHLSCEDLPIKVCTKKLAMYWVIALEFKKYTKNNFSKNEKKNLILNIKCFHHSCEDLPKNS